MSGFRGKYLIPTEEQAALVGHIVMDWAIVEFNLRHLATRLALIPDLPGRALTEGMGGFAAMARIERLIEVHRVRYRDELIPYESRLAIAAALQRAKSVRKKRNIFAHCIGMRISDDDIDFFDLTGRVLETDKAEEHSMDIAELGRLLRDVRMANEALEAVVSLVPQQAERWTGSAEADASESGE